MIQGASLPLREAARRAGVSLPTLRRRIKSGMIQAFLRPGPFGDQWEIPESELARLRRGDEHDHGGGSVDHDQETRDRDQASGEVPGIQPQDREAAAYWRGRWQELREILDRLGKPVPAAAPPAVAEPGEEAEALREALRRKTHELAHARNLVDSLRREKARLEGELQALRDRHQGPEPTLVDLEAAPRAPRFAR